MNRKIWIVILSALVLLSGCAAGDTRTVAVTSVADITGMGPIGWTDRFSGVVTARSEVEIVKDREKAVSEIKVKEGDAVEEGQVLFSYEFDQAEMQLQRAKLELQQLEYTLQAHADKKAELEKLKEKAKADQQLSYTIEIAETDALIRETEYNLATKEQDIAGLEESLMNLDVVSPVTGTVQTLNESGAMDNYGNELPFIVLTETGNRRVKAYVNETNIASVTPGLSVVIRSRTQDLSWRGTVSHIDFEASEGSNENYFIGGVDDTQTSSKYPFYIDLESDEGLILGQHVYVEPETVEEETSALMLPSYYIVYGENGEAFVWAQGKASRLEKRAVTLGAEDPMMGTVEILSGITAEDLLAFPEEDLAPGMPCMEGYEESEEAVDVIGDMAVVPDKIGG